MGQYYIQDQSQVCFTYSSGTYATPSDVAGSGEWIGLVQEHSVDENLNVKPIRYCGTATRNVSKFVDGCIDVTGKVSYYPQDFKMVQFFAGSVCDSGSPSPYIHAITCLNSNTTNAYTSGEPFIDFNIEDTQVTGDKITKKYVKGCQVDSMDISWSEGDFVTCDISYIAQSVDPTSGTKLSVTESSFAPWYSDMIQVQLPSGTTLLQGVRGGTMSFKNNLKPKHYNTGSKEIRYSLPTTRDFEISLEMDKESSTLNDSIYQTYFQSGTEFNMLIDFNDRTQGVGSRTAQFIFSGCRVHPYSSSTKPEDIVTEDITILPKSMTCIETNSVQYYRAWSGA